MFSAYEVQTIYHWGINWAVACLSKHFCQNLVVHKLPLIFVDAGFVTPDDVIVPIQVCLLSCKNDHCETWVMQGSQPRRGNIDRIVKSMVGEKKQNIIKRLLIFC